jgi:tRNA-Thr(GGU) m(6)t(6)A37 methyltransferase TsaA
MSKTNSWTFDPIAFFKCTKLNPLDAAQQGSLDQNSVGSIDIQQFPQWQQMLENLEGFSHLWLIFIFHKHSQKWKPKVWPPRSPKKVGVFASRSPYRPNPIGMSAVELVKIEGSIITIKAHDLLDGTPILDIKPYLAYSDSWPHAKNGWLDECEEYSISYSEIAKTQLEYLKQHNVDIESIIQQQLRFSPTEKNKKRINLIDKENQVWVLSIRTWRVKWHLQEKKIHVENIFSGYSANDLSNIIDKYGDKETHREFILSFK